MNFSPEHELIQQLRRKPPFSKSFPDFSDLWAKVRDDAMPAGEFLRIAEKRTGLRPAALMYAAAAAMIMIAGLLYYSFYSADGKTQARILAAYTKGEALRIRDGKRSYLKSGDILERHDRILLKKGAQADLLIPGGFSVRAENADFMYDSEITANDRILYRFTLERGKLMVVQENHADARRILEISVAGRIYNAQGESVYLLSAEGDKAGISVLSGAVGVRNTHESVSGIIARYLLNNKKNIESADEYISAGESLHADKSEIRKTASIPGSLVREADDDLYSLGLSVNEFRDVLHVIDRIPAYRSADFIRKWYGRDLVSIHLTDEQGLKGVIAGKTGDMLVLQTTEGGKVIYSGDISVIEYRLASR